MAVVAHDHRAPHACSAWCDGQRRCAASSARLPTRGLVVCGPSCGPHTVRPHALLPHDERGTAGPEKGAMAFLDDAETTTYRMLQQVLHNHCATHTLCLPHTLVACAALVALVGAQRDETRGALEPVVAHMLAGPQCYNRALRSWSGPRCCGPKKPIRGRGGAPRPSRRSRRRVWPTRPRHTSTRARQS